ncbi:MAG: hypothetical protein NWR47_03420, partial [Aestuariivirgaceae bacterium]|nr:hypothetical protein [Aestuariivirgaceae bacterium]
AQPPQICCEGGTQKGGRFQDALPRIISHHDNARLLNIIKFAVPRRLLAASAVNEGLIKV